jgi:hypothetical protein
MPVTTQSWLQLQRSLVLPPGALRPPLPLDALEPPRPPCAAVALPPVPPLTAALFTPPAPAPPEAAPDLPALALALALLTAAEPALPLRPPLPPTAAEAARPACGVDDCALLIEPVRAPAPAAADIGSVHVRHSVSSPLVGEVALAMQARMPCPPPGQSHATRSPGEHASPLNTTVSGSGGSILRAGSAP